MNIGELLRYVARRLKVDADALEEFCNEWADEEIEHALDDAHEDGILPRLLAGAIEDHLKERVHKAIKQWVSTFKIS